MTAWDVLREGYDTLQELLRQTRDTTLFVIVTSDSSIDALVIHTHLDLTQTLKELKTTHPDPIEILVRAANGNDMVLRSRHTRAFARKRGLS